MTAPRAPGPAALPVVDLRGGTAQASAPPVKPLARGLVLLKMGLVLVGLGLLLAWAAGSLPADRPAVSPTAVLAAVLLNQAALYVAALRLRATLAAFGMTLTARQAFVIQLRSLFYFFFVPMSVGYEIARFVGIRRIDPTATAKRILIALLMDRVLGLFAAVFAVAALAGLVVPVTAWSNIDPIWLLTALGVALVVGVALLAHGPLRHRVFDLLGALRGIGSRLVRPALLSLAALTLVCASVYAFAAGSGIGVGWAPVAFALSASLLGMAIPVSLLGVTLGEVAGVGTLALIGLPPGVAVLLAAVAYGGRLLGAIQGALIELWHGARLIKNVE